MTPVRAQAASQPFKQGFACLLMRFAGGTLALAAPACGQTPSAATPLHALATLPATPQGQQWAFLDTLVDDKRLVLFGESGHGMQQALVLRNQVFEHLVQTHGFTAIALETGFEDGMEVNDYVSGKRERDDTTVAKVFSFMSPRRWDANRQLIEWMRDYNARVAPAKALRFYGIEMLGNARYVSGADRSQVRRSADAALAYLDRVEPATGEAWRQRMEPLLAALARQRYADIHATLRNANTRAMAALVTLFEQRQQDWVAKTSPQVFQRAYRNALNARNLDADLRANGWWAGADPATRQRDLDMRDKSMAENVEWALAQEGPQGRVLVFAAFKHAARVPRTSHRASDKGFAPMGNRLQTRFKQDVAVIGMVAAHEASEFHQGSGLATFINAGPADVFAVNFRELASLPEAKAWWQASCTFGDCQAPLTGAADAVIFVKTPLAAIGATPGSN